MHPNTEYSIDQLLKMSFAFIKSHFQIILILSLIFGTLFSLITSYLKSSALAAGFVNTFLSYYLFIYYKNSSTITSFNTLINTKTNINGVIKTFGSNFWRTLLLTLLFIIPGIIYTVYWSLATFVCVDKNLAGKPALDYSKNLVKGHWWKIFFLLFISFITRVVYYVVVNIFFTDSFLTSIIVDNIAQLIDVLFIVASIIFYLNLDQINKTPSFSKRG